jgi:flagellar biosynthesis protein FliQ
VTEAEVIAVTRQAIWLIIEVSLPVLLVGLAVGVAIALLQALTQVQEITLVFVPKIVAMFLALFFFLPAMMATLAAFMRFLMALVASGGGG